MERIVVIRGGALGDGVVTLPAIHSLTGGSPQARLGVIGSPYLQRLAMPEFFVDQGSAACTWLFVDGDADDDSPPGQLLVGADLVLAYTPQAGDGALMDNLESLCSGTVLRWDPRPAREDRHVVEHLLEPLQRAGMMASTTIPSIQLSESERECGRRAFDERQQGQPLVLLHPGSGGDDKRWPLQSYQALAQQLSADGLSCSMICGPAEIDMDFQINPISQVPLILQNTLSDLIGLTAAADLFVGNDSGPAHVAAAVGTPTVTLFGPTNPAIWRPLAPHSHVVRAPNGRMESLEAPAVREAVLSILSHS